MACETYEKIYAVVRRIPRGRVATYGQVAELANLPGAARQVGYALSALDEINNVPWQRVINAKGEISARWDPACAKRQIKVLRDEGIEIDANGKISLEQFRWRPNTKPAKTSIEEPQHKKPL